MNEYVNLKLATNIPVTIEFIWDDVKRWEHAEYGVSYTANVHATWTDRQGDHDEDKASIRMTPFLMDKLIGLGAGKGSVVEICKVTNDANRTEYELAHKVASSEAGFWVKDRERRTVNLDGVETGAKTVSKAAIPAATPAATEASQPKETKSAPAPTSASSPSVEVSPKWEDILEQQQSLYERCLTRAQSIWTNFYGGEDKVSDDVLHATATTLVIALDRKGVRVPLTDNAKQIDFPLPEGIEEQPKDDAPDWATEDVPISSEPQ